jgi:hypothetical protein
MAAAWGRRPRTAAARPQRYPHSFLKETAIKKKAVEKA